MNDYVYILCNNTNTTIYTGITNNIVRRVYEHRVHKLVFYEYTGDVRVALEREKQIKSWSRAKKNKLINSKNPKWIDLYETLL